MNDAIDWLNELFYGSEVWGLIGVFFFIAIIYFISTKSKAIGVLGWLIASLMAITYLEKGILDPWFYWHSIILVFGGLFALAGGINKK